MSLTLTPLKSLTVLKHQIPAHNLIPNTTLQQKPLLIYRSAFPSPSTTASQIESHLQHIGIVTPQWRYTMYSTSHFHSSTHEVLCISRGAARLCFGHEENPGRVEVVVERGDVLVVPAGVAHRLVEEVGGKGFEMVGSYPKGAKAWDMCYGRPGEEGVEEMIKGLKWFGSDPIYGDQGPSLEV